jgi:hypothetical protein
MIAEETAALLPDGHSDSVAEVTRRLIDGLHEMPTASIVDQQMARQYGTTWQTHRNAKIRRALYHETSQGEVRPVQSPSLAEFVLRLAAAMRLQDVDVHILTTNYDDLLERVARDNVLLQQLSERYKVRFTSHVNEPSPRGKQIPIVHLHGYCPQQGGARAIVFSEADYIKWENESPLRDYLFSRFDTSQGLFVGSSLRDHNILALLRRSSIKRRGQHLALLPVQQDIAIGLPFELADYLSLRGQHLGVTVLRPDFYGQVNQFLLEVGLKVSARGANSIPTYDKRLRRWWKDWSAPGNQSEVAASPQGLAVSLGALAQVVGERVHEASHVKAELWVRADPEKRVLELWSSSQSVRTTGKHYWPHRVNIALQSGNAAVEAFAQRTATSGVATFRTDGRWTHYLSIPIILNDEPFYELPVGVVTLLFHAPALSEAQTLTSVESNYRDIVDLVTQTASPLLLPPTGA